VHETGRKVLRKLFIAVCALIGAAGYADFRAEVAGSYTDTIGNGTDVEALDLSGAIFLRPVVDSKGPYALAQFLSRASRLSYNYNSADGFGGTTDTHGLSARYIDVSSGWIGGASVAFQNLPESLVAPGFQVGLNADGFLVGLNLGKYVAENTTIELAGSFGRQDSGQIFSQDCPFGFEVIGCVSVTNTTDLVTETWVVATNLRHVTRLGRTSIAMVAGAQYSTSDIDSSTSIAFVFDGDTPPGFEPTEFESSNSFGDTFSALVGGTWFVNRSLGLGLNYNFDNRDSAPSVHSFGADVSWFVTPRIEVEANYRLGFVADSSTDIDTWRATVRTRF